MEIEYQQTNWKFDFIWLRTEDWSPLLVKFGENKKKHHRVNIFSDSHKCN